MNKNTTTMLPGFIFFLCLIIHSIMSCAQPANKKETLVLFNWANYLDPALIREFEAKFEVAVREEYFETDETRDQKLTYTMGKGYDLVLMSGSAIKQYSKHKWIAPLDISKIPNSKHIAERWKNAFPESALYGMPYAWGIIGITYRKDLVPETINSWKQLLKPGEKLRGKILMINDSIDTISVALKALGYSINSSDSKELEEAGNLLLQQKPFVKQYASSSVTPDSGLVTGDIWMSMMYNGDARTLQEFNKNIVFASPEEGSVLWVDYLSVMESSDKKELAFAFINFLNEPQNAARLATYINYATPNTAAEKFLSAEHLNDPYIYPSKETLEHSEFFISPPPKIKKKRNEIFSKLI